MPTEEESRQVWLRELAQAKKESDKNWSTAFWLSLLVGSLGADRFYLGYVWSAILKLVTLGGLGVWWLVDLVLLLTGKLRDADKSELMPPWRIGARQQRS